MAAPGPWREPSYPPYSYRPRSPTAPARVHPYAAVAGERTSFYGQAPQQPAIPGFYNPALPQPRPATPPTTGGAPAFPQPRIGLPPSLVPGRRSVFIVPRSQSNDFFFQGQPEPELPYPPPRHTQTAPVPPLPRKPTFDHPPLPPKPSRTSPRTPPVAIGPSSPVEHNGTALFASPEPSPAPSAPPFPLSERHQEDDAAILNRVLQMSAQEARRPRGEPILSEEEQMARAMEESLKISSPPSVPSPVKHFTQITASPEQGPSTSPPHPVPDLNLPGPCTSRVKGHGLSARPYAAQQISDDEAFARKLAEEEERMAQEAERRRASTSPPSQSRPSSSSTPASSPEADPLPEYDEAVSSPPGPAPSSAFYNSSLTAHFPSPDNGTSPTGSSSSGSMLGRSVSDRPAPPKSSTPPDQNRHLGRSQSCGETAPTAAPALLAPTLTAPRPLSTASSSSPHEPADEQPVSPSSTSPSNGVEILSNTQYLDAELLAGLSMNFGTPPISAGLKPFAGVIPNVVSLPYGRTIPFYIKAPSWRNLLKLMARLSGTRLEPTVEAMALIKTEMKLRIVVSFVKVHHASSEWHTVLYMTIDHTVPPNAPTGWKYRNGDPNILPWSYTLSQVPAFLRDGPDAPLSKYYTIPSTQETPFPVLPITFPNLATYLAGALESSRNAMHDSSSGLRRLAKYVDQFYPNDRPMLDEHERGGMRRRLKNLVGMGSRPQRDPNAEMYELVTPFVADEYGR